MKPVQILTVAMVLALSAGMASAQYKLTILHTNDMHSRLEPISRFDSGCSAEDNADGKCFGGSARLMTAIKAARARADNSILLDGGDQFQGSLFYTYYKGMAAAEMMNRLGYDAMTVGNHEFDDGPEVLRGFVEALNFPIISSNVNVTNEPFLNKILGKSVVIERGGEKIALIGLTPQDTDELASPGKNVSFIDPVTAVQAEVDRLTAEGINKIILMSHSGYELEKRIAAATTGVDVIVGGHSHTYLANDDEKAKGAYPTMVGNTAIVQSYAYGKFLGELNVTFDDNGVVIEAVGDPLIMDGNVVEDPDILARVAELAGPLDEIRNNVVARSAAVIDGDRNNCRARECEMGNLVADAMLARVKDQGIQIAIQNGGGLRASIDAGEVTMGEVLTVLPFQNTLSTFQIKGSGIVAALENGVSQVEDGAGRFPQVAGMKYVWDASAEPGSRIVEVMVATGGGFEPIDPNAVYGVVSNNYVRGGGDGYKIFASESMDAYDFGPGLEDVVAEFLAAGGPYTPYLDGRISQK